MLCWGPIKRFNPATCVCLSEARTWIPTSYVIVPPCIQLVKMSSFVDIDRMYSPFYTPIWYKAPTSDLEVDICRFEYRWYYQVLKQFTNLSEWIVVYIPINIVCLDTMDVVVVYWVTKLVAEQIHIRVSHKTFRRTILRWYSGMPLLFMKVLIAQKAKGKHCIIVDKTAALIGYATGSIG